MAYRSFQEKIIEWESLLANSTALISELPHLAEDHAELLALTQEGYRLESEQDLHIRLLRETNQKRRALEVQGGKLRAKLIAGAQSRYGHDSIMLVQFGINPRRPVKRPRLSKKDREAQKAAAGSTSS